MPHLIRTELGGAAPTGRGTCLLSLLVFSDVQVMDSVSPARCEWVELLADEPRWKPLLHMHRPYEALTHWALAAHVDTARRKPAAPWSSRRYDLALFTGDNIDNAQRNELDAFLAIVAGGATQLSAAGGVHEASTELGPGPWPYWCPRSDVADQWKPLGYPALPDFVERAGATVRSEGLGLAWGSLPGNHDLMRQGTALPEPLIERIAVGSAKSLRRPDGFDPADPLARFIADPAAFSHGATRQVRADAGRRAVDRQEWLAAHVAAGASGYGPSQAQGGSSDFIIDTEHVRIIGLDTNHPWGDCEGSIGVAQLEWLQARLSEVGATPGRVAVLASHHGTASLTNTHGHDPQRLQAAALTALAHRHPCVVAWLVGHRHLHRVVPHPGPGGGFWEITTGSLIDWPSQGRAVEFMRHPDGSLEIVCTLLDHDSPAGSLARLHHQLAQRFAGESCSHMTGQAGDGNVRLLRAG